MKNIWLKEYPEGIPAEVDIHEYSSLRDILEKTCVKFAKLPAYGNMSVSMSYGELDRQSRHFAAYLQHELGLVKGDRVAIMLPNLLQYPVAMFGALRAMPVVARSSPANRRSAARFAASSLITPGTFASARTSADLRMSSPLIGVRLSSAVTH